MTRAGLPIAHRFLIAASWVAGACWGGCGGKEGNDPNLLPMPVQASTGVADDDPVADGMASSEGTATGGPASLLPETYRFDCVDIQVVGDGDGEAFQAVVLENAWTNDIKASKLNILLTITERDEEAGTAMMQVTSGIGSTAADLCNKPDTISDVYPATYTAGVTDWQDARSEMMCSQDGAGSDGVGTYAFALEPQDVVYVYAENDDGTTFNCVPGGGAPDAVPIRAIDATVTMAPGERFAFGSLNGCLTVREATGLCSCIGMCVGDAHPDCGGCPTGSRPLALLLDGINPSPRCTDLLGEDAFDLRLGLVAEGLGYVPAVCG